MSDALMGVLELLLVFGVVLALALWEIVALRRDAAAALRQRAKAEAARAAALARDCAGTRHTF